VLDAFVNRNAELALEIRERDNEVDEIYERMLHELLTILSEHPKLIQPGISLLLLFRHLERVGDLAANISEEVYYLVKGDIIRHSDTH
jgi:phosphate transport system protein